MSTFKVSYDLLKEQSEALKGIANKLKKHGTDVEAVNNQLAVNTGLDNFREDIKKLIKQFEEMSSTVNACSLLLSTVQETYQTSESTSVKKAQETKAYQRDFYKNPIIIVVQDGGSDAPVSSAGSSTVSASNATSAPEAAPAPSSTSSASSVPAPEVNNASTITATDATGTFTSSDESSSGFSGNPGISNGAFSGNVESVQPSDASNVSAGASNYATLDEIRETYQEMTSGGEDGNVAGGFAGIGVETAVGAGVGAAAGIGIGAFTAMAAKKKKDEQTSENVETVIEHTEFVDPEIALAEARKRLLELSE